MGFGGRKEKRNELMFLRLYPQQSSQLVLAQPLARGRVAVIARSMEGVILIHIRLEVDVGAECIDLSVRVVKRVESLEGEGRRRGVYMYPKGYIQKAINLGK